MDIPAYLMHAPMDWILIGLFAALAALWMLRVGTRAAVAIALGAPLALEFAALLPRAAFLGPALSQFSTGTAQAIVFVILFLVIAALVYRMTTAFGSSASPLHAIFGGIAATVVLLDVWMQVPALSALWTFDPTVQGIFAVSYRFWWLLGAYILLAVIS